MGTEINDEPLENESDDLSDDTTEDKDPVEEDIDPIENEEDEEESDDDQEDDIQEEPEEEINSKTFYYNLSGYCYNPDYPEYGPSGVTYQFDWEDLTGDEIKKQLFLSMYLIAEDDHYGSFSDDDTGDVFSYHYELYNLTYEEVEHKGGFVTFPGVCSGYHRVHLQNITQGIGLMTLFQFQLNISNCGEYPVYWELGLISEPDPGNDWRIEFIYEYIPEE